MVHSREQFIKKPIVPVCRNCLHFKPNSMSNDFTGYYSTCEKFSNVDILTGNIQYTYVDSCRNDESKCGKEGKSFVEEKNLSLKILAYTLVGSYPNILILFTLGLILESVYQILFA